MEQVSGGVDTGTIGRESGHSDSAATVSVSLPALINTFYSLIYQSQLFSRLLVAAFPYLECFDGKISFRCLIEKVI